MSSASMIAPPIDVGFLRAGVIHGSYDNVELLHGDLQRLPLPDACCDVALMLLTKRHQQVLVESPVEKCAEL